MNKCGMFSEYTKSIALTAMTIISILYFSESTPAKIDTSYCICIGITLLAFNQSLQNDILERLKAKSASIPNRLGFTIIANLPNILFPSLLLYSYFTNV